MMQELARIRLLLSSRPTGKVYQMETAISRVASITIEQLEAALPVSDSVQS
jgi:hypothetical protein